MACLRMLRFESGPSAQASRLLPERIPRHSRLHRRTASARSNPISNHLTQRGRTTDLTLEGALDLVK